MASKSAHLAAGFCLLGLAFAHHPMLLSGMDGIQINHEDPRLINFLLEHGYQWLRGNPLHRDVWSPPFFFPETGTLAYSDSLLSAGPLYWPFRLAGFAPDTSFQLWMMTCFALNDLVVFGLMRSVFRLQALPSALGAFLFAFAGPRVLDIGHPQLLPHFFTLLAILFVGFLITEPACSSGRRMALWTAAGLAVVAQLFSSFYMGWFLIFAAMIGIFWAFVIPDTRTSLLQLLRRDWPMILGAALIAALPAAFLIFHYLDVVRVTGYRNSTEVMLAVPLMKSWVYMGPHSWLYRWMTGWPMFMQYGGLEAAHRIGVGLVTPVVCLVGLVVGSVRPSIRLLALTGLSLFILTTRFPRWSVESVALGCWLLCPLAFLDARGHPWERAFAVLLFAWLFWVLLPLNALLIFVVLLALGFVLLNGTMPRNRRRLEEATAVGICFIPAVASLSDSPFALLGGISGAVLVAFLQRKSGRRVVAWSPVVLVPGILASVTLLLILLELNMWEYVYDEVPGAAAIRVTSRVCLLLLLPLSLGFALFWERVIPRVRPLLALSLVVFCLLEQGMTTTTYSKSETRKRIESIASSLRGEENSLAFFFSSGRPGLPNWNDHVDAMWAGLAAGKPSINGYSGQMPKGWAPLYDSSVRDDADEPRVRHALRRWIGKKGLDEARITWLRAGLDRSTPTIRPIVESNSASAPP